MFNSWCTIYSCFFFLITVSISLPVATMTTCNLLWIECFQELIKTTFPIFSSSAVACGMFRATAPTPRGNTAVTSNVFAGIYRGELSSTKHSNRFYSRHRLNFQKRLCVSDSSIDSVQFYIILMVNHWLLPAENEIHSEEIPFRIPPEIGFLSDLLACSDFPHHESKSPKIYLSNEAIPNAVRFRETCKKYLIKTKFTLPFVYVAYVVHRNLIASLKLKLKPGHRFCTR